MKIELLTVRELQITDLIARGHSSKVVAHRLGITVGTVKMHLHHIYSKLQLRGRVDLVRVWLLAGREKLPAPVVPAADLEWEKS